MKSQTTTVAKRFIINFCCIFLLIATGVKTQAQTNPTAQNLNYSQNFGTTTFTVAPTGMAAWTVASSSKGSQSSAESSTPNGDATITAATTTQTTGGSYGYSTSSNGRFYIQTSSDTTNGTNQLATSIVTTYMENIRISYDVEMISAQAKTIGVVLQYRIGTTGSWTTISESTYSHNSSDRSAGQIDNFTELILPEIANNEDVVQLRWATWCGSEVGNYSGIGIDNISIIGTDKSQYGPIATCVEQEIKHLFSGASIGDTIVISINLPQGVTAIDSANLYLDTTNIVVDTSDLYNPTYTFFAPDTSFLLSYYVKADCETFDASNSTVYFNISDTINGVLNNTVTDTVFINSPWIIFDNLSSTNLSYNNAFIDSNYTRTLVYKNTGQPFTGELLFLDTIPNFNSAAIQFVSAVIDTVTSGTANIISSTINDSVVQLRIQLTNFTNNSSLFIEETIKLIDCPNGTNNHTYFSAFYGCADDTLCAEAQTTVFLTTTDEDANDKPVLDYTLLTKGYPDCWKDAQERIIRINNTGLSSASEVQIWFPITSTALHITENSLDSFEIYHFDGFTKTAIPYSDTIISGEHWITTLDSLAAGDSLFFRYFEIIYCIDSTNYDDYFNNNIAMHHDGFPYVNLIHPCKPTGLKTVHQFSQNQYIWRSWEHNSSLQQTFYNYINTMNGGDSANFEVTSSNLFVAALPPSYNNPGFIFNMNNSEILIELQLDSALGLVTDSLYLFGKIGGVFTAIYPDSIEYFLGLDTLIGGGDKIIAHFAIPDSFYVAATPQPYLYGLRYLPTSYYNDFFSSFKVKFRLRAYCEYMSGAPSAIVQRFFFVPDNSCYPDCKLPLAKVEDAINVHCPGCLFPGWNISAFDIQRTNFGFADDNNNNFPDSYPLQPADTNLVKIKNVMLRDTLECTLTANTSDGEDLLMFYNIGVDYKYAQLLFQNPRMGNLQFLGATGTFTDSNGVHNFTIPDYAGVAPDTGTFYLDLSIDSLKIYSGDTSLTQFWIGNDLTIRPTFAVVKNFTNPYFNIEDINALLYMAGTPFTGVMTKPDAFNYEIDTLEAMSDSLRSELAFWCTGYGGSYGAIGSDDEFIIPRVNHLGSETQNNYPCKNVLRYEMNTEVGSTVLPYAGNDQAAWNSFSYELRNLWMLDSIHINYPNGYILDSVVVINSQLTSDGLGGNTVRSCYQWNPSAYHDYDLTDAIINSTSATIYPARNLTQLTADACNGPNGPNLRGWDESKRYRFLFILKNMDCDTPLVYQTAGNYPITTYWSDFPTATNGDTVIVQTLGTGEFNKPDAGLTTNINTFTQDAPNSDLMMNITVNTVQTTPSTDSITHSIAENTFLIIHSPSGNVVIDSIVSSVSPYNRIYALNEINNDSLYGLGNVGYLWGAANFNVFAHYNCANIDVSDSILIYTGWNCNGYPDSLQPLNSVCYLDSVWIPFNIIKPGLQALLSVQDTVAICDTLHYDVKLTATGTGRLDSVNVWMPTSSMFSYVSGSGQLVYNGDTIVTPTGVDTLLFALSTDGLLPNFEQDTAHFLFDILPNCGFYTSSDEVNVFVTATNYCGNRLDTIFLGKRPEFIDLPEQDSLLVEILGDTVVGCNDATISIDVTNLGANPTGSANTLTVELPTGFTWASGDSASVVNGQTYTFDINGGITNLATQTIEFVTADTVGNGVYNIIVNSWLAQEVICGTDTCSFVQSGAASTDTVQITVINRDLLLDSTFVVASCYGDSTGSIDITVTGGTTPYTYSWINSSSVSYGTSQDLTGLPANTYIVTVTDSANCNFTDSIIVTSAGATISGGGSLCTTGSVTLTITLTGTAPWDIVYNDGTNNITVTGITSSPYTFSAIYNGTYTLVSVNGTTCVSGTAGVTKKGGCTCGSALASYTWGSGYTLAPGFYAANNDIYVTDTVTITNVILTMAAGKFIYISNGASLTLEHCHLYACTNMWLGIIVEPGGELIITDGTLIEDAEIAVYISTPNSSTTLAIDNAIFNRNMDAVFIDDYQSTASTTYTNFDIKNTVFTCRTIPYSSTWTTVAALQTLTNANTLDEHYTMGGYATTTLKAPFATDKSSSGITLLTVGTLSGGTYYEMLIEGNNGNNTFNLFDNLLYGINANSSNFTCKNNAFQYIIEDTSSINGMAINATDAGVGYNTDNRIKVIDDGSGGTNYFYDCSIGVNIDNYRDITVSDADFRSTQMPVSSTPPEGKGGVYINTPNCTQIAVDNNTITNIRNGIKFFADGASATIGGTYYTNAQSIHNVNITNNTIRANYSGVTLTNEYVIVGIVADNLITFTDYFLTFPASEPINVSDNHLYGVHSGISMNNWLYLYNNLGPIAYENGNRAIAQDNYILLRARTYPSSGLGQAGVYHTGNYSNYIINNNVQGFGINSSVWAGIYSDNLSLGTNLNTTKVECNLTENIAIGNYFINDHGAISYKNNEIKTSALGLLLDNAIIGNQGNSTYASDNEWTGSYPSGTFTTYTTNLSDPNNSVLFVQDTGSYNPATVGNGCGSLDGSTYTYSYGNGLDSAANASTLSCDALPTGKLVGNGSEYDLYSNNADVNRLEQLVTENGMDYGIFPTEQYINAQHRVYRWLNILPQLKDSSTILLNFYNAKTNHNIGRLAEIENSLALGKLNKAEALLSTITPNNDIEANHQKYYTAYIHFKKNSCNATDSTALWQLVTGCASRDGNIIHQARSLFNLLYQKDYTIYFDDCSDAVIGAKTNRLTTINTQQNRQKQFAVYPNPSNGEFKLELNDKQLIDKSVEITISNIAGKVLYTKKGFIQENNTNFKVALSNGIYVVNIKTNDGYQYSPQRITIIN